MGFRDAYNVLKAMKPPTRQQMQRLQSAAMSPVSQAVKGIKVAGAVTTGKAVGPNGKKGLKAGVQVLKNYAERNGDR